MAALFSRVTEAVRVGSLSRRHVSCSLERVAMFSDPSGLRANEASLSVVLLVAGVRVLEIGVAYEVVVARSLVIYNLRMCDLRVKQ